MTTIAHAVAVPFVRRVRADRIKQRQPVGWRFVDINPGFLRHFLSPCVWRLTLARSCKAMPESLTSPDAAANDAGTVDPPQRGTAVMTLRANHLLAGRASA